MRNKEKPPRSWEIDDLLSLGVRGGEATHYLKAVPVIILELWISGGRKENVANYVRTKTLKRRIETCGLHPPFVPKGSSNLLGALGSIQGDRNLTSPPLIEYLGNGESRVNLPYYESLLQEYRKEYRIIKPDDYKKLYPNKEPIWEHLENTTPKTFNMEAKTLIIHQVLEEYELSWQKKLQDAENRANIAELKVKKLNEKISESNAVFNDITDDVLRKRISTLQKSPLDTMIREAGVILEDRIRDKGMAGNDLSGTILIDTLMSPDTGKLLFSKHKGEQEGVKMLYRGAMQFIRNPPMHKLVEYKEDTARLLLRLIDSLLQLLSEAEIKS